MSVRLRERGRERKSVRVICQLLQLIGCDTVSISVLSNRIICHFFIFAVDRTQLEASLSRKQVWPKDNSTTTVIQASLVICRFVYYLKQKKQGQIMNNEEKHSLDPVNAKKRKL
jgi:hypothetical protein